MKIFSDLAIEGNFIRLVKDIYKKTTAWWKTECSSLKIKNKARISVLTTSIHHFTAGSLLWQFHPPMHHPWDDGSHNRICPYWALVTRAAFNSGKVNIVAINDPFIDLHYQGYILQYDSTHGKFNGTVHAITATCKTYNAWPLWETAGCPEYHPCIYWYHQCCGQGCPWAEWEEHWHGLLCPYSQSDGHGSDLLPEESCQIWWHQEGGKAGTWRPLKRHPALHWEPGHLSPVTLTVTPTLPPWMLELALLSKTTLSNLFSTMAMNLVKHQVSKCYGLHHL